MNPCTGDRIFPAASPDTTCINPHNNPDTKLAFTPHRIATIKIGIIANEMEIAGDNFIDGKRSNTKANAEQIAISIKASKLNFFKKISPFWYC